MHNMETMVTMCRCVNTDHPMKDGLSAMQAPQKWQLTWEDDNRDLDLLDIFSEP